MLEPLEARCLASLPGVRHGFFTRAGGVSRGLYASLNCGPGSSDESSHVAENRGRVARHLGAGERNLVTLYQVHGATALAVEGPVAAHDRPKADAVVTRTPGLAVGVLTADCTPVLFADPDAKVVAAAHAGWRGAAAGIIEAAIAEMERQGARRSRIRAAIGPTIGQAAYEVGPDFEASCSRVARTTRGFFFASILMRGPISICRVSSQRGSLRPDWPKLSGKAPAPTRTNCFSSAFAAQFTATRPITAVK